MSTRSLKQALVGLFAAVIVGNLPQTVQANGQDMVNLPDGVIVDLQLREDGADIFFAVPPGPLYAVYVSTDASNWEYAEMGAQIAPGLVHAHDPGAVGCARRFYRIVLLSQDCRNLGNNYVQWRVDQVRYAGDLNPAQKAALAGAITDWAGESSLVGCRE